MAKRKFERNKSAKIASIIDAMILLIERKGYENVTIRDISGEAGVSKALIHKYFPGGKLDVVVNGVFRRVNYEQLMLRQPEKVDFDDFPGYMRTVIKNIWTVGKENEALSRTLILAALFDSSVTDRVFNVGISNYPDLVDFFCRFRGVDINHENYTEILSDLSIVMKSVYAYSTIVPGQSVDEDAWVERLVRISLKICGYRPQDQINA